MESTVSRLLKRLSRTDEQVLAASAADGSMDCYVSTVIGVPQVMGRRIAPADGGGEAVGMLSMVAARVVQGFFEVRVRDESAYGLRGQVVTLDEAQARALRDSLTEALSMDADIRAERERTLRGGIPEGDAQ